MGGDVAIPVIMEILTDFLDWHGGTWDTKQTNKDGRLFSFLFFFDPDA